MTDLGEIFNPYKKVERAQLILEEARQQLIDVMKTPQSPVRDAAQSILESEVRGAQDLLRIAEEGVAKHERALAEMHVLAFHLPAAGAEDARTPLGQAFPGALLSPTHTVIGRSGDPPTVMIAVCRRGLGTADSEALGRLFSRFGIRREAEAASYFRAEEGRFADGSRELYLEGKTPDEVSGLVTEYVARWRGQNKPGSAPA